MTEIDRLKQIVETLRSEKGLCQLAEPLLYIKILINNSLYCISSPFIQEDLRY